MQTLQPDFEQAYDGTLDTTHPALRELAADPVEAYAEEVRLLRHRVAQLEAELAAAKAPRTSTTSPATPYAPLVAASEFTACTTPAVSPITAASPTSTEAAHQPQLPADPVFSDAAAQHEPVVAGHAPAMTDAASRPGFAQAWSAEGGDATFEERVAERAFFHATTVDEESRTWLLAD